VKGYKRGGRESKPTKSERGEGSEKGKRKEKHTRIKEKKKEGRKLLDILKRKTGGQRKGREDSRESQLIPGGEKGGTLKRREDMESEG